INKKLQIILRKQDFVKIILANDVNANRICIFTYYISSNDMKKSLLTILFATFIALAGSAQGIAIIDMNGNDVTNGNFRPWQLVSGEEIGTHFKIVNTSQYDKDIT